MSVQTVFVLGDETARAVAHTFPYQKLKDYDDNKDTPAEWRAWITLNTSGGSGTWSIVGGIETSPDGVVWYNLKAASVSNTSGLSFVGGETVGIMAYVRARTWVNGSTPPDVTMSAAVSTPGSAELVETES